MPSPSSIVIGACFQFANAEMMWGGSMRISVNPPVTFRVLS